MDRFDRFDRLIIVIIIGIINFFSFYSYSLADQLLIISSNDTHGQLLPFKSKDIVNSQVAGLAERKSIIDTIKKSATTSNIIIVDSGDILAGEYISNLFFGLPDILGMGMIGYHAFVIGNHEFDYGLQKLLELESKSSMAFLSANIIYKNGGNLVFKPYVVKKFANFKVGILGLSSPETPNTTAKKNVEKIVFLDPIVTAKRYLSILKEKEKCEILIILSHLGFEEDKNLAAKVPGYDYIFGGHSHTKLSKEENIANTNTAIFSSFEKGVFVGETVINIEDKDKKIIDKKSRPILVADIVANEDIKKHIEQYKIEADKKLSEVVAVALDEFSDSKDGIGRYVRLDDMPLSNFINDALREQSANFNKGSKKADIYFDIGGTYRASIPKGEITLKNIYNVLPADKAIQFFDASGKEIMEILNQFALPKALENWQHKDALKGGFLLFSGMTLTLDLKNKKIVDVKIAGRPIEMRGNYRIAIQSHLKDGSDGYTILPKLKSNFLDSFAIQKDLMAEWLKKKKRIDPKDYDDNRLNIINAP